MAAGSDVPGQSFVVSAGESSRGKLRSLHMGKPLLIFIVSLLLGRAEIAHVVSPFALAFFVVVTELRGARRGWPAWAAVAGGFWIGGVDTAVLVAAEFAVYLLVRRTLFLKKHPDLHWMPFVAGVVDIVLRLAANGTDWSRYNLFLALAEGALVTILAFIFLQCTALLGGRQSFRLRIDQLLSVTILTASVISGMTGIVVHGVALVLVGIDFMVLLMAVSGGVGVSTTVGMIVGTLGMLNHSLTLGQVAILGFSAMLVGIIKEAGRLWIALAFVASEAFLTATLQSNWTTVVQFTLAALVAGVLITAISSSAIRRLAEYIPGTYEHNQSELNHIRRVRHLLSEKISELSQVFDELAETFADTGDSEWVTSKKLVDETMSRSARDVCSGCAKYAKCWEREGLSTYRAMVETITRLEDSKSGYGTATPELKERCIRLDAMMSSLRRNAEVSERDAQWLQKIHEQAGMISAQLSGVADVIRSVATHVERTTEASIRGEEEVLGVLEQLGLYVDSVRIVNLERGKVEVEVVQPSQGAYENSVRMIAPALSGIVGENIGVHHVVEEQEGPCTTVFTSARRFDVTTAVATVAMDGRLVSGDSHTALDLGNGRYALAVSDGMGNGERAHKESSAALELLKKLLKAGFHQQLAIQTVNSTLLLRSPDEIFTTLDMTLIDLYSARAEFLKIGSAPSFVKRGGEVHVVSGSNVPIGILQDIDVQTIDKELQSGDTLILMSDGVYDAAKHIYDQEDWMKRQIEKLETDKPQEIADTLIEVAVRINHGEINDDMTVLVARVEEHQPEWATIHVPGVVGLRRQEEQGKRNRRGA